MIFLTCSGGDLLPSLQFSLLIVTAAIHFLAAVNVCAPNYNSFAHNKNINLSLAIALLLLAEDQELTPVTSTIEERQFLINYSTSACLPLTDLLTRDVLF